MIAAAPLPMTNAEAALAIARTVGPVLPLCPAGDTCVCGGRWDDKTKQMVPHTGKEIGKAPIGRLVKTGVLEATTNSATIDRWWRAMPNANVGLALKPARVLFVDPDSPEALAEARANGIDGGSQRDSRNVGWLFRRPADCPVINVSKSADHTDLELRTDGYAVVGGVHANGAPVRIDPYQKLQDAPAWTVDRLGAKAAARADQDAIRDARRAERSTHAGAGGAPPVRLHSRGLRRWSGELVQTKPNGETDRSDSLYFLALDLAECNASESAIAAALADRDAALGWDKFTGRDDADARYQEMAEKAVAYVVGRESEQQPTIVFDNESADAATLRAALEDAEATIVRLRRRVLDDDDRLEVLEDVVHSIDDVLNLTNEEMSASDKVIMIGTARWLPSYRSKKEASGQDKTVAIGYAAKVCGSSKSTVGATLKRFSSIRPEDGAPYLKVKTRKAHVDEDGHPILNPKTGKQLYTTPVEYIPLGNRVSETLRAAVAFAKENRRKKHGGSQEAADVRWGRCPKHDNRDVLVKGYCPDCGKVVAERMMSLAEFDLLDEQLADPEQAAPACVEDVLIAKQVAHPDAAPSAPLPLDLQLEDSEPAPTSLFEYTASRPQERPSPWRCHCGSLERYPDHPQPGEFFTCDGCRAFGSEPATDPAPADPVSMGRVPCCRGEDGAGHGAWRNLDGGRKTCVTCGAALVYVGSYLRVAETLAAVAGGAE